MPGTKGEKHLAKTKKTLNTFFEYYTKIIKTKYDTIIKRQSL